jgi:molybdopterin-guanine dinucleotide biosynthesis protein A
VTAGVLLTGGASRRLGVDKATVRLASGATLAERALDTLAAACDPVIEVGPGVTAAACVREDPPGSGPVAALLAGAARVGAPVVLLACDYPRITVDVLRRLADHDGDTLVPIVAGRAQHVCARYGPVALAALGASFRAGERSFRALALPAAWIVDDLPADVFLDVDTPADLDRLGG